MTYGELVTLGEQKLKEANINDSKIDAFLLFEHIFGISKSKYLLIKYDEIREELRDKLDEFDEKLQLRCLHIPLQHITGIQEFMGMDFVVNKNVLIPRQDTEILVENAVLTITEEIEKENPRLLDMCTGSGCIAISLTKICKLQNTIAVDYSNAALEVAKENNQKHSTQINFINSDLFTSLNGEMFDIIVSNPPYIRTEDIRELMPEVKDFEPIMALDGTSDGLEFYRKITKESKKHLNDGGFLLYEIGFDQGKDVKSIMKDNGFDNIEIIKDLSGLDRVVKGHKA